MTKLLYPFLFSLLLFSCSEEKSGDDKAISQEEDTDPDTASILIPQTQLFPDTDTPGLNKVTINDKMPKVRVEGLLTDFVTGDPLGGAYITIYREGLKEKTVTTDNEGKFSLVELDLGLLYRIKYQKKDYISRTVAFDLRNIPPEDTYELGWDVPTDMPLLKKADAQHCADRIASMESTLTSTIQYSIKTKELDWDMATIEKMREEMKNCVGKSEI